MNMRCRGFRVWRVLPALLCVLGTAEGLEVNSGLSGAWYDPERPGRGLLIEIMPERGLVFAAWFTFGGMQQRWYTAEGSFEGAQVDLTVYASSPDGDHVRTDPIGTAQLTFAACSAARFAHDLAGDDPSAFDLVRLGSDDLCDALGGQPNVPKEFRLRGTALGFDTANNSAECLLDLIYEVQAQTSESGKTSYEVTVGGYVQRTVLDPAGDGFSFAADVFNPSTTIEWTPPFGLLVGGPGVEADEHAFWRALARFDGTAERTGRAVGAWTCAGFSFSEESGYVDNGVEAEGTWYIDPIR